MPRYPGQSTSNSCCSERVLAQQQDLKSKGNCEDQDQVLLLLQRVAIYWHADCFKPRRPCLSWDTNFCQNLLKSLLPDPTQRQVASMLKLWWFWQLWQHMVTLVTLWQQRLWHVKKCTIIISTVILCIYKHSLQSLFSFAKQISFVKLKRKIRNETSFRVRVYPRPLGGD